MAAFAAVALFTKDTASFGKDGTAFTKASALSTKDDAAAGAAVALFKKGST
ncbi:hypothetical protein [Hydrogenispora ethanolica]|jgi:hypothetical protein|uniref:hypothetical protein n=1 Tax=Hydrogenispora ethanolica TaxID=1082276 RepID=UPI0014044DF0|nr:hypothetical protein [Hydrogenispora ethanolica]